MAKREQSHPPKQGCLRRLLFWICTLAMLVLVFLLSLVLRPQSLADVAGYGVTGDQVEVRDLEEVLKKSIRQQHVVNLSEEEINHWLAKQVTIKQEGLLAGQVSASRVWVRLTDGLAEVVIEREVFGQPLTVSMFLQTRMTETSSGVRKEVLMHGGPYAPWAAKVQRGGRFGRLVVPQGYLHLIKAAYVELANACSEEVHLAFDEMVKIEIEDGRLVLDPRPTDPSGEFINP